jgi:hypothetical protein
MALQIPVFPHYTRLSVYFLKHPRINTNAAADSVMLYFQHDFNNITFENQT